MYEDTPKWVTVMMIFVLIAAIFAFKKVNHAGNTGNPVKNSRIDSHTADCDCTDVNNPRR